MEANIADFADLLRLARSQQQPQRLLFVFVKASMPEDATPQQQAEFAAGIGGEIEPLMAVDKAADAFDEFNALVADAAAFGPPWSLVFVSSLSGRDGRPPDDDAVDSTLDEMIERVRAGWFEGMLPFDPLGRLAEIRS
ncbi:MAG: hypothetical protein PHO64_12715 [Thiomonas sp.]|nr:hypothetical protein [Thiomonas sp.]MDE2175677.1 ribonucleotide reductase subunit alpha [Betaproteobacteria bacterium]MDE2270093.1 ribonucleotide reductase subunit alpha [Betaproteobacteria bacterium]CQR42946.1 conserved hypothetical protein [Thiomonas sp. CB3]